MSLSDLAAIGSFVSGIAVVVSFVFLALQIRQSNRNQKSLMQQGRTTRNVEILLHIADPFVSEMMLEAHADIRAMDPKKIWAFYGVAAAVFWTYEDSFLQFQRGMLDRESWSSDATTIKRLLASPAYRVAWKMAREGISGGYREYVDSVMRDVANAPRNMTDHWNMLAAEELPSA
ncbi:MAG TPA: hypothetical protein VHE09_16865 [Rhizomicrobium sp.]|jgi:hypothetical protein|nr:hypothetical protein [Rhizomicrobium sp.]